MKKTNYLVISFILIVFFIWIFSIDELSEADKYVGINKEIFDAEQMSMPENQNSSWFSDTEKGSEDIHKFFGYNLPLTFWLDFTKLHWPAFDDWHFTSSAVAGIAVTATAITKPSARASVATIRRAITILPV